jgi:putative ABC transport system permease protein
VQVVGFDPGSGMGGPWNVVAGAVADLRGEDTVVIDELYKEKLGVTRLGQTAEIAGRRARIVGFTRGIRSFTTTPYVFCTFKNSLNYMRLAEDQTIYFLVRLKRGAEPETVRQDLLAALGEVEVVTNDELHARTQRYWVLETGAGVTTLLGAVLGLIVGVVVVAQTIYAATVDHIREFGTLKAMGASNGRIYAVIMAQAAISAVMGYIVAIAIAWPVSHASSKSNAPIYLPPEVAGGALLLALAMCTGAALISIRKATSIEPAMVFRG